MANIDSGDKEKFDAAFAKYVDDSPVGAENVLYEKLEALVEQACGGGGDVYSLLCGRAPSLPLASAIR